jgi:K(+)-stimulated pyrophosphate-energized sodium pump
MSVVWYVLVLAVIAAAIAYVVYSYQRIRKMPEGTQEMAEMAGIIRSGANTFMKTEYKTIVVVVVLLAVIFSLFVEKTSGITFLFGALMSSCACVVGMRSATYANVRTANKARESLSIGETVKVALCGGSISGLSVQALGLLGLTAILIFFGAVRHDVQGGGIITSLAGVNPTIMRISTYSLGCSLVAMFNRVAGGNYTKGRRHFRRYSGEGPQRPARGRLPRAQRDRGLHRRQRERYRGQLLRPSGILRGDHFRRADDRRDPVPEL